MFYEIQLYLVNQISSALFWKKYLRSFKTTLYCFESFVTLLFQHGFILTLHDAILVHVLG